MSDLVVRQQQGIIEYDTAPTGTSTTQKRIYPGPASIYTAAYGSTSVWCYTEHIWSLVIGLPAATSAPFVLDHNNNPIPLKVGKGNSFLQFRFNDGIKIAGFAHSSASRKANADFSLGTPRQVSSMTVHFNKHLVTTTGEYILPAAASPSGSATPTATVTAKARKDLGSRVRKQKDPTATTGGTLQTVNVENLGEGLTSRFVRALVAQYKLTSLVKSVHGPNNELLYKGVGLAAGLPTTIPDPRTSATPSGSLLPEDPYSYREFAPYRDLIVEYPKMYHEQMEALRESRPKIFTMPKQVQVTDLGSSTLALPPAKHRPATQERVDILDGELI